MKFSLTYYQLKAERLKLIEGVKQQEQHKLYLLIYAINGFQLPLFRFLFAKKLKEWGQNCGGEIREKPRCDVQCKSKEGVLGRALLVWLGGSFLSQPEALVNTILKGKIFFNAGSSASMYVRFL